MSATSPPVDMPLTGGSWAAKLRTAGFTPVHEWWTHVPVTPQKVPAK